MQIDRIKKPLRDNVLFYYSREQVRPPQQGDGHFLPRTLPLERFPLAFCIPERPGEVSGGMSYTPQHSHDDPPLTYCTALSH